MMKKYFDKAIIQLHGDNYLALVIFIAPLLNFLSGINVDLYTPSLPAIAHYYSTSAMVVKNTITATMVGFAIGCIVFGTIIDIFGRRRIILFGLLVYIIASFLALVCTGIEQLMLVRFVQGMVVSIVSIGGRAIIMDNFTGHRLNVGLLYTSVAYGLGPIIAPFIGGILQYHFGWEANFLAYAIFAISLIIIFILFINESLANRQAFSLKNALSNYAAVLQHGTFMAGVFIMAMCQITLMIYPTVGAFIVENILHRSPIVYGNTALLVSCGYLGGTLTNRLFIKKWHLHHLTSFGFALLVLGVILQIGFALAGRLNFLAIMLPIILIGFGNGFVFINTLGRCIKLFPNNVGIAIGVLTCLVMGIAAIGIFIVSHITVDNLQDLIVIFAVPIILQLCLYFTIFTRGMKNIS